MCEALIDALTFWCAGYRNVTAAYGVDGFTDEHLAAFQAHGIEPVLIAYDRDEAGERGAAKLAERLRRGGDRMLAGAVPERHGRERLRLEGDAGGEVAGRAAASGSLDGSGRAAGGASAP